MGRYKKYATDKALSDGVDAYFNSISRTVPATEMVYTGRNDKKGHPIYKSQPIKNDLGDPIKVREYIEPPALRDLCLFLNISRQTWKNYMDNEKFLDTATRARARVEAYLASEIVKRTKGIDGIKFVLMEDFGWREKLDVNNHETVEEYLQNHSSSQSSEF